MTQNPQQSSEDSREREWSLIREVMNNTQPKQPSASDWSGVRKQLTATWQTIPQRRTNRWKYAGIAGLLIACAAAFIIAVYTQRQPVRPITNNEKPEIAHEVVPLPQPVIDPLAEYSILPIATPSDVMIRVVRGDREQGIVVVDHPIPGMMTLAKENEIVVRELGNAELSQPEPGDAPLILSPGTP